MRRDCFVHILFALAAAFTVAASVITCARRFETGDGGSLKGAALRCAIQTDHPVHHLPGLTVGYNYDLLQRFASDLGDSVAFIANARAGSSWLDSLRKGRVDIVVIPLGAAERTDSVIFSRPIDSLTVWAVREGRPDALQEIDEWIGRFMASGSHEGLRDSYLLRYNPSRRAEWGRKVESISPYDSLVRAAAARLDWDWRLLCAVIYQESQFHIEFRSRRGAEGLMQIMPSTAANLGVDDLFDPAGNLDAGVSYLRRLQGIFRSRAADADELRKFTLAAFNAGEGRILDCIRYAESEGADASTWEGLSSVIPQMTEEMLAGKDSLVRLGPFDGAETIYYVGRVLSLYEDFKKIKP